MKHTKELQSKGVGKMTEARAFKRMTDGDRATTEPGGMECMKCNCIFIGDESHDLCAICFAGRAALKAGEK